MSFTLKAVDAAVNLITFMGAVSQSELYEAYIQNVELACHVRHQVFCIFDVQGADAETVIVGIRNIVRGVAAAAIDPEAQFLFVVSESFSRSHDLGYPLVFTDIHAALAHVQHCQPQLTVEQ
jgi:hypothetical protein